MPLPILAVLLGKVLTKKFIMNRVMAGSGTMYFYRRGRETGQKRYYIAAASVYVLSWILLIVSFGLLIKMTLKWWMERINP